MDANRTFDLAGLSYLRTHSRTPGLAYALAVADQVGRMVLGRAVAAQPPRLEGKTVVVSKVDHLGDLLMVTPLLVQLRSQVPTARIVLLVGGWSVPLARLLQDVGLCDGHVVRSPWALNAGAPWWRRITDDLRTAHASLAELARSAPAALLDLRPFTPNTLLLAHRLQVPYRVGFALRGLSYTLHTALPYDDDQPFGQLFLDALPALGLRGATYEGPTFGPFASRLASVPLPDGVPTEPYVVVQPASRNAARNAPLAAWQALLAEVARTHTVVFLGGAGDAPTIAPLLPLVPATRRVDLTGRTSLAQLFRVCAGSAMAISVDSLMAHIGLATQRPTLVLIDRIRTPRASYPPERAGLRLVSKDAWPDDLRAAVQALLDSTSNKEAA